MQVIRTTLKTEAGKVLIDIPDSFGKEVEVTIRPVKDSDTDFSYQMMKLQEETGFAKEVLGNEKEDVWNEL